MTFDQETSIHPPGGSSQPLPMGMPAKPLALCCPVCGTPMVPGYRLGQRVETCAAHGSWLPEGQGRQPTAWLRRANVTSAVLCGLQILGVAGAIVAAAIQIETIVATGPVFSILGILAALGSFASRSASNAVFGLSAAAMSLFCFVLIASLSWGPSDAARPVSAILVCYGTLMLPVALLALYRTLVPRDSTAKANSGPWQFSIRNLLTTTFVLAVVLAVGKLGFEQERNVRLAIAIGLFAGSVMGTALAGYLGAARRYEMNKPDF